MAKDLSELRKLTFVPTRIPRLDALEVFVPTGSEADPEIARVAERTGFSRWFPVEGGHRAQILYQGGDYDQARFSLVPFEYGNTFERETVGGTDRPRIGLDEGQVSSMRMVR